MYNNDQIIDGRKYFMSLSRKRYIYNICNFLTSDGENIENIVQYHDITRLVGTIPA
jgi:hypothetical protein